MDGEADVVGGQPQQQRLGEPINTKLGGQLAGPGVASQHQHRIVALIAPQPRHLPRAGPAHQRLQIRGQQLRDQHPTGMLTRAHAALKHPDQGAGEAGVPRVLITGGAQPGRQQPAAHPTPGIDLLLGPRRPASIHQPHQPHHAGGVPVAPGNQLIGVPAVGLRLGIDRLGDGVPDVQQVPGRRGRVSLMAAAVPQEVHQQHRLLLMGLRDRRHQRRIRTSLRRVQQQPRSGLLGHWYRGALPRPVHQQLPQPHQQPLRLRQPGQLHRPGTGRQERQGTQRRALRPDHQSQPSAHHIRHSRPHLARTLPSR